MSESKRRRSSMEDIDETVGGYSSQGLQRQKSIRQTSGRGRPGNTGQLGVDSTNRSKATYDVTEDTQTRLRGISAETGIALKDLAEAALRGFVNGYEAGRIDLSNYQVRAERSLRAQWNLDLPENYTLVPDTRQH